MSGAIFTAAIALATASPASFAKLYKWVDANGNVSYSERKPPDVKAETIELHGIQAPQSATPEGGKSELDRLREKAQADQKNREFASTAAGEMKAREERLKKNCEIAQQNMRVLQNSSRIQDKDPKGKPYFLTEDQIKARMTKTAEEIKEFCKQ